jgi:hypothetical protein
VSSQNEHNDRIALGLSDLTDVSTSYNVLIAMALILIFSRFSDPKQALQVCALMVEGEIIQTGLGFPRHIFDMIAPSYVPSYVHETCDTKARSVMWPKCVL